MQPQCRFRMASVVESPTPVVDSGDCFGVRRHSLVGLFKGFDRHPMNSRQTKVHRVIDEAILKAATFSVLIGSLFPCSPKEKKVEIEGEAWFV